jgi:hypothetical protein
MERFPQISMGGPRNDGSGLEFTTEASALANAEDVQAVLARDSIRRHDRVRAASRPAQEPLTSRRMMTLGLHAFVVRGNPVRDAHGT